jgi:hypothetical protein
MADKIDDKLARELSDLMAPFLPDLLEGHENAKNANNPKWKKASAAWKALQPVLKEKIKINSIKAPEKEKCNGEQILDVTLPEDIKLDLTDQLKEVTLPKDSIESLQKIVDSCGEPRWSLWDYAGVAALLLPLVFLIIRDNFQSLFGYWVTPFWIILMVSLIIFLGAIGHGFTGFRRGILIDRRNMLSLSKLQMAAWTILVISGYMAFAAYYMEHEINNPLDIGVPATLWALMGISTASLIGSPLIKNDNFGATLKEGKNETEKSLKIDKDPTKDIVGSEVVNKCPMGSTFSDLFRGEEVGNYLQPDLSKVQMFLFTFIVWIAYALLIYQLINDLPANTSHLRAIQDQMNASNINATTLAGLQEKASNYKTLPDISGGMATLLAISNAGYLAFKSVPREKPPERNP